MGDWVMKPSTGSGWTIGNPSRPASARIVCWALRAAALALNTPTIRAKIANKKNSQGKRLDSMSDQLGAHGERDQSPFIIHFSA